MKFLLIAGLLCLCFSQAIAQHIVINEIMYAPVSGTGEPEWIELYNPSDSAITTIGWKFSNHLHTYAVAADTIAPNGYLVLTKDSINFLRKKYSIPDANILQTMLPALVNSGDDIVFKDSLGTIIDSVKYLPSWGGANGTSLERIDYAAPSDSTNFGSCVAPIGATPAALNSISRKDFDLALVGLSDSLISKTDISITVTIENKGRKEISDGTVSLFANSSFPIAQSQITASILPLAKQDITMTWQNADYGRSNITADVNESQDQLRANDTIHSQVYFPIPRNALVINEIMPLTKTGTSEWVELYNNSTCNANLDSTELLVSGLDTIYRFRVTSLTLPPQKYGLIIADSNFYTLFPSLRGQNGIKILNHTNIKLADSGNMVMLINTDTSVIDSLHFYSSWHLPNLTSHSGISLERKQFVAPSTDPNNWGSSLDPHGSTPLAKNSYSNDSIPTAAAIEVQVSPNPFSPDGDGFEDITNITILIPSDKPESITARIYDLRGRLRSTLPVSQSGVLREISLPFAGKDDNGLTLPIGLYTLVVESSSGLFKPQRTGIVIMKKAR